MVIVRLPIFFGPHRTVGDANAAIFAGRQNKSNR
jgi:hypothetical protein